MVTDTQLRRRAAELGLGLDAAVRENALLETMAILADLNHNWVLRGGTALAYGYFGVHRLSEDLDLTAPAAPDEIDGLIRTIAHSLSDRLGLPVAAQPPTVPLPGPDLKRVELSWTGEHRVQIDFSWHELTARQPVERNVVNPYPGAQSIRFPMWALEEIMANKWFILAERSEPRDLFDLWFGLTNHHVEWADLVDCHRDKYGFAPVVGNVNMPRIAERWAERLGPQIRNLPAYDEIVRELRWHVRFEQGD